MSCAVRFRTDCSSSRGFTSPHNTLTHRATSRPDVGPTHSLRRSSINPMFPVLSNFCEGFLPFPGLEPEQSPCVAVLVTAPLIGRRAHRDARASARLPRSQRAAPDLALDLAPAWMRYEWGELVPRRSCKSSSSSKATYRTHSTPPRSEAGGEEWPWVRQVPRGSGVRAAGVPAGGPCLDRIADHLGGVDAHLTPRAVAPHAEAKHG